MGELTIIAGFSATHDLIWSTYFGGVEFADAEKTTSLHTYLDRLYFSGYTISPTTNPIPLVEFSNYYWQDFNSGGVDSYLGFFDLDGLVNVVDVEQEDKQYSLVISPNPTNLEIDIKLLLKSGNITEEDVIFKIISGEGKCITSGELLKVESSNYMNKVNISKLSAGIYNIVVFLNEVTISEKFIKNE